MGLINRIMLSESALIIDVYGTSPRRYFPQRNRVCGILTASILACSQYFVCSRTVTVELRMLRVLIGCYLNQALSNYICVDISNTDACVWRFIIRVLSGHAGNY